MGLTHIGVKLIVTAAREKTMSLLLAVKTTLRLAVGWSISVCSSFSSRPPPRPASSMSTAKAVRSAGMT
jgi:hypothetical protein